MAKMLDMAVNGNQDALGLHLPRVELSYDDSVSTPTGLAPNEMYMGRLPSLLITVYDRAGVAGYQRLARDHLALLNLATYRQ